MTANPIADYHLVHAVVLVALAAVSVGDMLGLGRPGPTPPARDRTWMR